MPLNDPGLSIGDERDGYRVSRVINALTGSYVWQSIPGNPTDANMRDVTPVAIPASLLALTVAVDPATQPVDERWEALYGPGPTYQQARVIGGVWIDADAGNEARITSPDTLTYTESTDGAIEFVVDGNPVGQVSWLAGPGMPKWTLGGVLDPTAYAGTARTIAQRNALVPAAGWLVYVVDGAINEYQMWNGAAWVSLSGVTPDRFHLADSAVTPTSPGNPTLAEVQAVVTTNTVTDTLAYYTGDDLPASTPSRAYWVDGSGVATAVLIPAADDWQLLGAAGALTAPGKYVLLAGGTYTMPSGAGAGSAISVVASAAGSVLSTAGSFFSSPGTVTSPWTLPLHTRIDLFSVGGDNWSAVKAFSGRVDFANGAASGVLGDINALMVDIWVVDQTTASIAYTLPSPAAENTTLLTVHNTGTQAFTVNGSTVTVGGFLRVLWDGTAWVPEAIATFTGASSNGASAGTVGSVVAPPAGSYTSVLTGDGAWHENIQAYNAGGQWYTTGTVVYHLGDLWRRTAASGMSVGWNPLERANWERVTDNRGVQVVAGGLALIDPTRKSVVIASGTSTVVLSNPEASDTHAHTVAVFNASGTCTVQDGGSTTIGTVAAGTTETWVWNDVDLTWLRLAGESSLYRGSLASLAGLTALTTASLTAGEAWRVGDTIWVWDPTATTSSGGVQPADTAFPGVTPGYWVATSGHYRGAYSTSAPYSANDIVFHGGALWRANSAREAGVWGAAPTEAPSGFNSWTRVTSPVKGPFSSAQSYALGDVVYDASGLIGPVPGLYRADAAFTAGALPDMDTWSPIAVRPIYRGDYGAAEYAVGDVVQYLGDLYRCVVAHGSNSFGGPFTPANWSLLSADPSWEFTTNNIQTVAGHWYIIDGAHTVLMPVAPVDGASVQFASPVEWSTRGATFTAAGATTIGAGQTGMFAGFDVIEMVYNATADNWVVHVGGTGGATLYAADGTLGAARTVTMAGNSLTFAGSGGSDTVITDIAVNSAKAWFPEYFTIGTYVTATPIIPNGIDGAAQELLIDNTSTGAVNISTTNSVSPGWQISLIVDNNDVVARNVVFASSYKDITGAALGTVSVAAGTERVFTFTNDGAGNQHLTGSLNASGADTIQNINATGTVTAWGSVVVIGATAPTANMVLTLPTAAGNTGKTIKLVRVDNTAFTVTLAAQVGETVTLLSTGSELNTQHGSLTVEATTATEIRQVAQVSAGVTPTPLHYAAIAFVANQHVDNVNTTVGAGYTVVSFTDANLLAIYNPNGIVNTANNTVTVTQAGAYEIIFGARATANDLSIRVNGTIVAGTDGGTTDNTTVSTIRDLSAGDRIEFALEAGIVAGTTNIQSPSITVKQLPVSSVVDPGMVPVTPLHWAQLRRNDSFQGNPSDWVAGTRVGSGTTAWPTVEGSGAVANANGTITLAQAGRYLIEAQINDFDSGASTGLTWQLRSNGAALHTTTFETVTGADPFYPMSVVADLPAGAVLDVFPLVAGAGAGTKRLGSGSFFRATQLPAATVVDSGSITPTPLAYGRMAGNGQVVPTAGAVFPAATYATPSSAVGMTGATTGAFTVTTAGTYRATASTNSRGSSSFQNMGIYVNGVLAITGGFWAPDNASDDSALGVDGFITLAAGDVVTPRAVQFAAANWHIGDFVLQQIPVSTVVDPGLITPTPLARLHGTLNANQTTNLAINDHVKFDLVAATGGTGAALDTATAYSSTSGAASVGRITLTGAGRTFKLQGSVSMNGGGYVALRWHDATTGAVLAGSAGVVVSATYGGSTGIQPIATSYVTTAAASTLVELRIVNSSSFTGIPAGQITSNENFFTVEEVPTSTVVNPGTVTVNDQAASGYLDVGGVRMMWGQLTNTSDAAQLVTLPAAFASTAYSISLTPDDGWTVGAGEVTPWKWSGKTTTSFNVDRDDDVTGTALVDWIAIGRKP